MGTLPVMYGRIISIMQDLRRPPARMDTCMVRDVRTILAIASSGDWVARGAR